MTPTEEANTHLIAAVPRLLAQRDQLAEALRKVLGQCRESGNPQTYENARAALRAVEGER